MTARRPGALAPRSSAPYLVAVVSGAMCFLAVCALEAASGAARVSGAWTDGLSGAATVRVPAPDGREAAEPLAAAAVVAVTGAPGVAGARVLSAEELAALTGPWVGRAAEALGPAPELLIDVTLDGPQPDAREMQRRLDVTAPGAAWDDHAAWRAPLAEAAAGFRRLAFWSVGLMGAALAAMVTLAARASLSGAAATVSTLRLIGARDGFVARAFDRPIALRALVGGAVGSAAAAGALVAAPPLGLAESLGVALGVYRPSVILAVAAPIASAVLAYATARAAILVMLRSAP